MGANHGGGGGRSSGARRWLSGKLAGGPYDGRGDRREALRGSATQRAATRVSADVRQLMVGMSQAAGDGVRRRRRCGCLRARGLEVGCVRGGALVLVVVLLSQGQPWWWLASEDGGGAWHGRTHGVGAARGVAGMEGEGEGEAGAGARQGQARLHGFYRRRWTDDDEVLVMGWASADGVEGIRGQVGA